MQNYKTIEEKAADWCISPRHIQYLCRNNKISGAIKRAGSWFIPDDINSPAKNSKSGAGEFNFVGTKKKIFVSAVKQFMLNGFDKVSMSDIGGEVGVRQSTIYNHFKSKQVILDTIYDFYCHNYLKNRPGLAEIEAVIKNGTPLDIILGMRYYFSSEHLDLMNDITKIIFQRIGIDSRAREIAKSLMVDEGIKYVSDVFHRAVAVGKLAPFNTHAIAVFINSIRIFTLFHWILDSSDDSMAKLLEDEQALYEYCSKLIEGSRPAAAAGSVAEAGEAISKQTQ